MTDQPLRTGIWCAVSSKAQAADDKESLSDQEAAGRRFTESIGGTVAAVYLVPGHTRAYVFWHEAEAEMPAYRQVREDLEAGKLDVIHAVDSDRLGRDAALVAQFESLAQRHGCEVYKASAPHPVGQQTAGHRYLSAIMSVRAQEDSALRVYRHRMGMKRRIRDGLMAGTPPLGYEPVHNGADVVGYRFNTHIETMARITDQFLQGLSYHQIAVQLAADGIPSVTGGRWTATRIVRLMSDDTYAGFPSWGPYKREGKPSEHYPALWDVGTFRRIMQERQRRKHQHHPPRHNCSPYSGVAYCARCGQPMHRHTKQYRTVEGDVTLYDYMRCGTHAIPERPGYPCHPNYTRREAITRAVSAWLADYATPERIAESLAELGESGEAAAIAADIERAESDLADLGQQRDRLALALAAGKMDPDIYHKADSGLLAQVESLEERLVEWRGWLAVQPDPDERRDTLAQLSADFVWMVDEAEPEEMSVILQRAGLRVWCEDGEVVEVELA